MSPTLIDLFEQQADRVPDALAVIGEDGSLTYRELDEAANRTALELIEGGLTAGRSVLCGFQRGCASLVAQLAVYKAGAVYVPIDPDAPWDRLRQSAARTRAAAVLTAEHRYGNLAGVAPLHRGVGLTARSADRPHRSTTAEDTAYIVFTSGSTGEPKGVVVSHRAIVGTVLARSRLYTEPVRRLLMIWQVTFDAAIGCTWWALADGGAVEFAPASLDGIMASVDAMLSGAIPISHTAMTPSHYHSALQRLDGPVRGPSAVLVVAGEPCPEQLVTDHFAARSPARLYNEYGPTEAAVWCTGGELRPGEEITVGPAVEGAGILVLDPDGNEVGPGGRGEVFVTGVGLADGYLGDPAQTAARFVEHPAGRRYRTGDVGRLRPDGRLVVVGRTDHQIKVRGYRVEPGEVETVLQSHPEVAQAVVTERRGRLVAFVVPREPVASGRLP
ncbi:amino acid adenylation domain-containing protein [Catenulispora subtropica]|uniref:AMP-dependent synthetase/ligase domain-containing protein n=1 Tax=Catenulispora subtropica TaxID=450798 RepID=A0ABP5DNH8_9ACTN